eukprot:4943275-Alexandrium_andersonii.AAC.1
MAGWPVMQVAQAGKTRNSGATARGTPSGQHRLPSGADNGGARPIRLLRARAGQHQRPQAMLEHCAQKRLPDSDGCACSIAAHLAAISI